MSTSGKKYQAICEAERYRTMAEINKLPEGQREDAIKLFIAIQEALNGYVREIDREINYRTPPAVFRLAADELDRIAARMQAELQ